MTKSEAIELLEDLDGAIEDNHGRDYDEAFRMAIESLSAEPCKSTDQNVADVPSGDITETKFYDTNGEVYATIPRLDIDLISKESAICAIENTDCELSAWDWDELTDAINKLPSADRPTLKQTDTMIIADALRYLIKDTERHEIDRTRAEELREQILKYGASMCHSADRPKVNSAEWVAEKEKEFEELNRPKGEWIDREDSTDMFFLYRYECSVCGGKNVFNSSYCPNCGAHMG